MHIQDVREHMEVIGADGVHVGTVDAIEGNRIKLAKDDGRHGRVDHHRYVPSDLVADIEDGKVRLSAKGDVAVMMMDQEAAAGRK